jgi:hypothetical protein
MRVSPARQLGCRSLGRAQRRVVPLSPRYQTLDRAPECSSFGDDDECSTSGSSRAVAAGEPALHASVEVVQALERLYLTPLDWSRGLPLVTIAEEHPAAEGLVFAAQQQQQQQKTPPPDQRERSPDYYANVGDAIRTLREDIPLLFERDLNCEFRMGGVAVQKGRGVRVWQSTRMRALAAARARRRAGRAADAADDPHTPFYSKPSSPLPPSSMQTPSTATT